MAQFLIHQINQGIFTNRGRCYWLCQYIQTQNTLWQPVATYAAALHNANIFNNYVAMFNWANQQNLVGQQLGGYGPIAGAFNNNRLYRCEFWFGPTFPAGPPNHEIILVTNAAGEVCYFEPNFGFYRANNVGLGGVLNNRQVLEHYIAQHYAAHHRVVGNFGYLHVRQLNQPPVVAPPVVQIGFG